MPVAAVTAAPSVWQERWIARAWLWKHSKLSRVRQCGRTPISSNGVEWLRYPGGQVSVAGTQHCASVWSCPVCSARIVYRRAAELQTCLDGWHRDGHRVGFFTLTLRHTAKMPLDQVWQTLMDAWAWTIKGGVWTRFQRRFGVAMPGRKKHGADCRLKTLGSRPSDLVTDTDYDAEVARGAETVMRLLPAGETCDCPAPVANRVPTVRTVEALQGRHGWHMHLHVLVFFNGDGDSQLVWNALSSWLLGRWGEAVGRAGGYVDLAKAVDAELISPDVDSSKRIGEYLAKSVFEGSAGHSAVHWEVAGGCGKLGRAANRTPWQLLDDAAVGDELAAKKWAEWEIGSRGRRQMWITGALLNRFGLRDTTDAEIEADADSRAENWSPAPDSAPL